MCIRDRGRHQEAGERCVKAIADRRHHRMAPVVLLVMALLITGAVYAALTPTPAGATVATQTDVDAGRALFQANCATCHGTGAMCHGATGKGGALTEGKSAPSLGDATPTQIYEAMLTGPASMPVFNDANLTPEEKRDVIALLDGQKAGSPGGADLGGVGPVSEGLWAWVVGMGLLVGCAVWIGAKSS